MIDTATVLGGGLSQEIQLPLVFIVALTVTLFATPWARRLAVRTKFFDRPVGYKRHSQPTPYLGGAAIVAGLLVAMIGLGSGSAELAPVAVGVLVLFAMGTLDDRFGLGIAPRFALQVAVAIGLWATGLGWQLGWEGGELALTVLWVVGLTNAFNLMDNLDGAAATVGAASAAGIGAVAISGGDPTTAAFALALAGACLGFLPFNLSRPAKIFLGDGGSMPIGFAVAALAMTGPRGALGWQTLLATAPLAGLVIFDTTLVVISRVRRGVNVLSGGRDHLTHRLHANLHSARAVALVLAVAQGLLCLLALALIHATPQVVAAAAGAYLTCGVLAIAALEPPLPRPLRQVAVEAQPKETAA
jgi:UDP-GlcNAc:undecaprenyl-phosphate GlcNAc-1-phosphate transferase